jgi:hypothetical protein
MGHLVFTPMAFTVAEGGAGHDEFKGLCEMAVVVEPTGLRNIGNGTI